MPNDLNKYPVREDRLRYRQRKPGETVEEYAKRMAKAHAFMAGLMDRTRRPWEYD